MSKSVISVENLSKAYRIGLKEEVPDTIMGAMKGILRAPFRNARRLRRLNTNIATQEDSDTEETLWALKDVSFEVNQGDVLGIIGRNGAGKSTLLKVLSRITEPTSGRAVIRGRVSSLLEVGTGFHPELTGRDNIYMNGTILGMRKKEIDRKFDEIVDFSGVEKFLDTPCKRYSSGMQVRLAFAVAAHLEPEILVIDEVLAVGDAEFQQKCLGKMQDVAKRGRTVLFVSHNMQAVRSLCSRAISLRQGMVISEGLADDIVNEYLANSSTPKCTLWKASGVNGEVALQILEIEIKLIGSQPHHQLQISVKLKSTRNHEKVFLAVDFFDKAGDWIMQAIPTTKKFIEYSPAGCTISAVIDLPPLIPGQYSVGVWLGPSFSHTTNEMREAVDFTVLESPSPDRTMPHSSSRGYIVPLSRLHGDHILND